MNTVYSPQYRINLLTLLGEALAGNPTIDLVRPLISSADFKLQFGKRVIDKIKERTLSGIDKNGNPLKSYSSEYKNSLKYKIYQKTGEVNMKLTGEMLSSMTVVGVDDRTFVTVEFLEDHNKNKAHGHITGRLGKSTVRDFFGLPREIEIKILKETIKIFQNENLIRLLQEVDLGKLSIGVGAQKLAVGQNNLIDHISQTNEDILQ